MNNRHITTINKHTDIIKHTTHNDNNSVALLGAIGYILLVYFAISKFIFNHGKGLYMHMTHNLALAIACLLLSFYYYNQAMYDLYDTNDYKQKKLKILGHVFYIINLLMALFAHSTSIAHDFDIFGILGHGLLLYSALTFSTHLYGLLFLIIYFVFKAYSYNNINYIQMFSSLLLFGNYIALFIIDYDNESIEENKANEANKANETNNTFYIDKIK